MKILGSRMIPTPDATTTATTTGKDTSAGIITGKALIAAIRKGTTGAAVITESKAA